MFKDWPKKPGKGEPVFGEQDESARGAIGIMTCMAQDMPDLAVTAPVVPQRKLSPTQGAEFCVRIVLT